VLYTIQGKNMMNTFGCVVPSTYSVTQAAANAIANTLSGVWASSGMAALVPPNTIFTGVDLRDLRTLNQPLVTSTVLNDPGVSTSIPLPRQVSLVITARTAQAGRQFRGRWFIGGWAQNAQEVTDGNATSAAGTAAFSWINNISAAAQTNAGPLGLIQRLLPARTDKKGETLPERPPAIIPITSWVLRNSVWDTMRRRIRPIAR
jgi:hypothetical protein